MGWRRQSAGIRAQGPQPTPGTPGESRRMEPDPPRASSRGPGEPKASLKLSQGGGGVGGEEVPHPWLDSIPWCVTGFRASTSWDGVSGGQGTRFTGSSPAGWSRGEARGWRAGWLPRPGAPSPLGVPPLGPPPALGERLGAPGLARLPGFLCPDGKRLYTLRRAPSLS